MGYKFTSSKAYRYRPGMLFLGVDEHGREIGIDTERHALTVAGSGAGKGVALLIPNARRWPHNLLAIDPKGEITEAAYEAREALGQQVAALDPFNVANIPERIRATFNPLAEIEGDTPRGRAMLMAIGDGLVVSHNPQHMEWTEAARDILTGLAAFTVAAAPPEERTFAEMRRVLMQSKEDLYEVAQAMAQRSEYGGLIRNAGVMIMTACDSEKGLEKDALGLAQRATKWLDEPAIAETLSRSSFKLSDLKNGSLSVFLVLPADMIAPYAGFLRLFVKNALLTMGANQKGSQRCLFLLDEFYSLGKLTDVVEAAGRMRSYGVQLWPFVQNVGQIAELYGQHGTETLFANADAHVFFGVKDHPTLEAISRRIGNLTATEISQSVPLQKHVSVSTDWDGKPTVFTGWQQNARDRAEREYQNQVKTHEHAMRSEGKPRITPENVEELIAKKNHDKVARSMIVFAKGGDVLNLKLQPYFVKTEPPASADAVNTANQSVPLTFEVKGILAMLGIPVLIIWTKLDNLADFIAQFPFRYTVFVSWIVTFSALFDFFRKYETLPLFTIPPTKFRDTIGFVIFIGVIGHLALIPLQLTGTLKVTPENESQVIIAVFYPALGYVIFMLLLEITRRIFGAQAALNMLVPYGVVGASVSLYASLPIAHIFGMWLLT